MFICNERTKLNISGEEYKLKMDVTVFELGQFNNFKGCLINKCSRNVQCGRGFLFIKTETHHQRGSIWASSIADKESTTMQETLSLSGSGEVILLEKG